MLEIYELLDRFELLYPTNSKISDLRRSYIDQDLSSIFRLVNDDNKEDLRKLIMEDNIWSLWKLLTEYSNTNFIPALKNLYINKIKYDKDCFSRGQIQSKLWLIYELKKLNLDLGTVFLCAGWYGTLATMIFENNLKVDKIRSFDIDESTVDIAEIFNKSWFTDQWKFKSLIEDIYNVNYEMHTWQCWSNANNRMSYPITDIPNTIINTSCEHLSNFVGWYSKIPAEKLVILQANNFHEVEEHVNTYNTIEEFSASAPMKETLYEGELFLPKYTRFMKIGYK
jgi:hypothetical protein